MKPSFHRDGERVMADLTPAEVLLLRDLHADLRAFVDADLEPDDPVASRLFPPAVGDDVDDVTIDLLHASLLADRLVGLDAVLAVLNRASPTGPLLVELVDDEPHLFLGVLNDLRLAISARIGIATMDPDEVDQTDVALRHALDVLHHLGWWVEELVEVLDPAAAAWADGYEGPL